MNSINKNGCSVCATCGENFTTFTSRGKKYYQYDFRTGSGELFSTVAPTLEKCRDKRDIWLKENSVK